MRVFVLSTGLALCAFAGMAKAQTVDRSTGHFAAGLTVGSDGLGADLKYALSPTLVLRARGAGLGVSHSVNSDGIHYSGRVKLATGGGFIDWHPFRNGFLLSGGVVAGQREVTLGGSSSTNVTLNGHTYTSAQLGSVSGRGKLPSAAGFVGLGYDSTFVHRGPIGFSVLAGAQLGDAPKVTLTSNGLLASTPVLNADLMHEQDQIRRDLDFTRYYPAVSVGLSYRF